MHLFAGEDFQNKLGVVPRGLNRAVLFTSDEQFYPCSGRETAADTDTSEERPENRNIVNIGLTPIGPGPWDPKSRAKLTKSQRLELISLANAELV